VREAGDHRQRREVHLPGHFIRQASHVDRLVLDVITERLGRPDLSELLAASEDGENAELFEESRRLRDRLARIDADYDDGIIDARRWRGAKQKVGARLGGIDRKLGARKGSAALGAVTGSPDPAQRFAGASLMSQRSVIGALVEVRLRRVPKGRPYTGPDGQPVVDPSTVVIDWKR
jgi:site-specific DNA recombinase